MAAPGMATSGMETAGVETSDMDTPAANTPSSHAAARLAAGEAARLLTDRAAVEAACRGLQRGEPPALQAVIVDPGTQAAVRAVSASVKTTVDSPARGFQQMSHRMTFRGEAGKLLSIEWRQLRSARLAPDEGADGAETPSGGLTLTLTDSTGPREFWALDGACVLVDWRRRLIGEAGADAIQIMDPRTGLPAQLVLLNPPVPVDSRQPAPSDNAAAVRVALVDSGVNYLIPAIAAALARDGSGRILGYDFWDQDARPFDSHPVRSAFHVGHHGTRTAALLIEEAPFIELLPYRYPRPDMRRMADLVSHAAGHGVSIMGLPLGGNERWEWDAFEEAAQQHPDILFIASAGNNGRNIDKQPVYPAALPLQNMLVVSSADDFARPANGVNWGPESVDYLLPAENRVVTDFNGQQRRVSGSSYAVPRMVALAARYQQANPSWRAADISRAIARRFADGTRFRTVSGGYIADPLATLPEAGDVSESRSLSSFSTALPVDLEPGIRPVLQLPLDVLTLDPRWQAERLKPALQQLNAVLRQCGIVVTDVRQQVLDLPSYQRDLATGPSRTVLDRWRPSGPDRRVTVVLARDTQMLTPFDGEAFGRGNTRFRPWLADTVWLTLPVQDTGLALAHELFHVLANSGEHVDEPGNLMQTRTSPDHTALSSAQCAAAREQASQQGLLQAD